MDKIQEAKLWKLLGGIEANVKSLRERQYTCDERVDNLDKHVIDKIGDIHSRINDLTEKISRNKLRIAYFAGGITVIFNIILFWIKTFLT